MAAVDYQFPWNHLITRFKDHDALDLAHPLVKLMVGAVPAGPKPWVVVPVPASPTRLQARGYNPAWELARRLAAQRGLRAQPHALKRLIDTPPQRGLDRAARALNVRGAFAVHPRHGAMLAGEHVALVDDVMTTGATLAEAAHTVRQAGASSVQAWVCARTPGDEALGDTRALPRPLHEPPDVSHRSC